MHVSIRYNIITTTTTTKTIWGPVFNKITIHIERQIIIVIIKFLNQNLKNKCKLK